MLAEKYVKINYKSYDDFIENCKIHVTENFNFGFDVVDEIADTNPDKKAPLCGVIPKEKKEYLLLGI
ncbi:MAG: hypothetical protein LE180_03085 [Endomicrobium sp.]|nr:hypothetical protein [Endomicrobium sp.]